MAATHFRTNHNARLKLWHFPSRARYLTMKNIPITGELYDFILQSHTHTGDAIIQELSQATQKLGDVAEMQIALEQTSFLSILVGALGARRAIEIGTFTGTSSLCIARAMPANGRLLCLDVSGEWTAIAREFWRKAGVAHKIELRLGDARQSVKDLGSEMFDFAFIDADKSSYDTYYEALLPHMRPGALFIFDNMLRGGRVVDPQSEDDEALRTLNLKLANDPRVEAVLVPIADGLNICRVK